MLTSCEHVRGPGAQVAAVQTCPICSAGNPANRVLELKIPADRFSIQICHSCGHACRLEARGFDDNIQSQLSTAPLRAVLPEPRLARWPRRTALVARQVARLVPKKGKVLDIGCSNGEWLHSLGPGWDKFGVEVSPQLSEIARAFTSAKIFCGPLEEYAAPENEFDLITAFALIEHLADPRAFVEWVCAHLKPSGCFVLMTGDRESEVARRMGDAWPLYASVDHESYFSARSVRELLWQTGFGILREEWRHQGYAACGRGARWQRLVWKVRELLGLIRRPHHDHYYCYATKPGFQRQTGGERLS